MCPRWCLRCRAGRQPGVNATSVPVGREWSAQSVPIVTSPIDAIAAEDPGKMNLNLSFLSGFECIFYNVASFEGSTVRECVTGRTSRSRVRLEK